MIKLPMQEIAVEFVHSVKTRRRFSSLAKTTFRVSTRFTSLLFAVRTSKVANKRSNDVYFYP